MVIEGGLVEVAEELATKVEALVLPRVHLRAHVVLEGVASVAAEEDLVVRLMGDRTDMEGASTTKQV